MALGVECDVILHHQIKSRIIELQNVKLHNYFKLELWPKEISFLTVNTYLRAANILGTCRKLELTVLGCPWVVGGCLVIHPPCGVMLLDCVWSPSL